MSFFDQEDIKITDEEFRLIRDMMYNHCGVFHDDTETSKFFIEKRLQNSLQRNQLSSFSEFYYMLKYDKETGPSEMSDLIHLLTIHETYFFREDKQLCCFQKELLPELQKSNCNAKKLRIWSAGCSTGEEPYTLAMLISESRMFDDWDWEIIATDISPQVLSKARKGSYGASSFKLLAPEYESFVPKYFKEDNGINTIIDEIKKHITFFTLNLIDEGRMPFIPEVDLIFCRNVIIYFDMEIKKRVINTFKDKLSDNGYLLLGHSESLMTLSNDFILRHFKYDMLYQKEKQEI